MPKASRDRSLGTFGNKITFPVAKPATKNTQTMSNIYIHKDGNQLGPFTEQQLKDEITQGHFSASDMAWKEGTPDWVPINSLLGGTPPPVPPAAVVPPASPIQQAGNTTYITNTTKPTSPKGLIIASWIMIGGTCLIAMIPGIGFATWLIAFPVLLVTFILGIIALTKGGTLQGILILLTSLIVAPIFIAIAPLVTTAGAIAASDTSSTSSGSTSRLTSSASKASSSTGSAQNTATATNKIGDVISTPKLDVKILSARKVSRVGNEMFNSEPSEGATYVAVTWQYKNTSSQPIDMFSKPSLKLKDANNVNYSADVGASGSYATEVNIDEKVVSDLNPGITVKTADVFEVSKESIQKPGWTLVIDADKEIEVPLAE